MHRRVYTIAAIFSLIIALSIPLSIVSEGKNQQSDCIKCHKRN